MTNDKTALDALDRLENDALSGRDGYGDARKDAEIIRNFINTRPQPSVDAVMALDAFNWLKSMEMISFNDTGFNKGVSVITYSEQLKLVEDFLNGKK